MPVNDPEPSGQVSHRARIVDLLLISLILAVLLPIGLWSPPIVFHGEAREGLVVQAIVHDHRWILPTHNGELPHKPPLYHWIAASFIRLFGLSDFTVRLPSGLAAWVFALVTFIIGIKTGGRLTGWLAFGALLGMHGFWRSATEARVDMVFTACITISITGFFFWYRNGRPLGRSLCYLGAALAVLAKGPIGLVIPGLVVIGFLAWEGALKRLGELWSWSLAGAVLLIDFSWYALAYLYGGQEFIVLHLLQENTDRFFGRGVFAQNRGISFFKVTGWLVIYFFPWNLVLPWALVRRMHGERGDTFGRFLHLWWIVVFLFFALAARVRSVYLLPLYPAIALLAARAMALGLERYWVSRSEGDSQDQPSVVSSKLNPFRKLSVLAMSIVLFDFAHVAVNQTVREVKASRNSLIPFKQKIESLVPDDTPLYADSDFRVTDVMVLEYQLRRPINRRPASTCKVQFLLSTIKPNQSTQVGMQILTSFRRKGVTFALIRVPQKKSCAET
ncbi:MAG: ArnT family glycosyltransferase [Candidatus Binatia bacterium]